MAREIPEKNGADKCGHCKNTFLFNFKNHHGLRIMSCPHCTKKNVIGEYGLREVLERGRYYYILSIVFLLLGLGITIITFMMAGPGQFYIIYTGGFFASIAFLAKGASYRSMRMSPVQNNTPVELQPFTVTLEQNA